MRTWLAEKCIPAIGYVPVISRLMKDWYSFHFQKSSDLEFIIQRPWVSSRSFLALSRWYLGFDPLKNTPSNCMIWVKLPNLPLELWTIETLSKIGNSIGKFIYVDPWCRGEKDKRIAWILIEKPYKGGYPNHIVIAWEGAKINQRLDFWGIPFRCSKCHHTGHLIKNCQYRLKGRTKGHQHEQGRILGSDPEGIYIHDNLPFSQDTAPIGSLYSKYRTEDPSNAAFISSPTPEPIENPSVPLSPSMDKGDFVVGTHPILIPSRSPSPVSPFSDKSKGKGPVPTPTQLNSPV